MILIAVTFFDCYAARGCAKGTLCAGTSLSRVGPCGALRATLCRALIAGSAHCTIQADTQQFRESEFADEAGTTILANF